MNRASRPLGAGLALGSLVMALTSSCSLAIDRSTAQCRSDTDCSKWNAVCDRSAQICVARPITSPAKPDPLHDAAFDDEQGNDRLGGSGRPAPSDAGDALSANDAGDQLDARQIQDAACA